VLEASCAVVQCGAASGLTLNPGGRSTRTSLTLPSGVPSNPVVLNEKSVMPNGGWPAAC
jgi:hypothetical protein